MSLARLRPLFFVCLFVCGLGGCSPTFDWREARPADELLALFPCKPDRHTRQILVAGLSVSMQLSSCTTAGNTFAVSQIEAGDVTQVTPLLMALRAALVANIAGAAAAMPPPLSAHVPGETPHALAQRIVVRGKRPDGSPVEAQGQFFCKGLRIYQATVVAEHLDAAALDVFFSSLKLPT